MEVRISNEKIRELLLVGHHVLQELLPLIVDLIKLLQSGDVIRWVKRREKVSSVERWRRGWREPR